MREERRQFPRYNAPEFITAIAWFPSDKKQKLQLKDISIDGFCFETEAEFLDETFFNLSLQINEKSENRIELTMAAKVVWYTRAEGSATYTVGVQFLSLEDDDRRRLQKILNTLTPKQSL